MAEVETILGAAISELVVLLKKTIQKHKDCPALLKNLDATLVSLHPLIQEMENLNRYLGRPKEEIESLKSQVDAGIKCVLEISKSKKGKYIWSMSHHQLSELGASLKRLYENLAAQTARNGMETLLCTRMIFGLLVVIALVALLLLWSNGLIRLHAKESPGLKITENSLVNMDKASTIRVNHAERNWLESVLAGGSWLLYKLFRGGLSTFLNLLGAFFWLCIFFGLAILAYYIYVSIKSSWGWVKDYLYEYWIGLDSTSNLRYILKD